MKLFIITFLMLTACSNYNLRTKTEMTCVSDVKEIKATTCLGYKNGIKCRATLDTGNITIYDLIIPGDLVCHCNSKSFYEDDNRVYYNSTYWRLNSDCDSTK